MRKGVIQDESGFGWNYQMTGDADGEMKLVWWQKWNMNLSFNTVYVMYLWDMQEEIVVQINLKFKEFTEPANFSGQEIAPMYIPHIHCLMLS